MYTGGYFFSWTQCTIALLPLPLRLDQTSVVYLRFDVADIDLHNRRKAAERLRYFVVTVVTPLFSRRQWLMWSCEAGGGRGLT